MSNPTPKIGDRIKVTDTWPSGDVQTREFTAIEIGSDGYLRGETLGAYPSTLGRGLNRQVEITKRALLPEPQGLGALVRFERTNGAILVAMRVPEVGAGYDQDKRWQIVEVNDTVSSYGTRWSWESVNTNGSNHEVLSEGVEL